MTKKRRDNTTEGYDMLVARFTWTPSGIPLTVDEARAEFGPHIKAYTRPGWFWRAATPASAARIRAHGHKAVGAAVTTWIPPQSAITIFDAAEPPGNFRAVDDDPLGPGELRDLVLGHLRAFPHLDFSPGDIARAIGRPTSRGAVTTICRRLVHDGAAVQVPHARERYRAAEHP